MYFLFYSADKQMFRLENNSHVAKVLSFEEAKQLNGDHIYLDHLKDCETLEEFEKFERIIEISKFFDSDRDMYIFRKNHLPKHLHRHI